MLLDIYGIVFGFYTWMNLTEKKVIVIIHRADLLNSVEYKANLNVDLILARL